MDAKIKRIGNSKGVIIPAEILHEFSLSERDTLDIRSEDGRIVLTPIPKEEPFTGPFTGPFAELSGDTELWGGSMTGAEYAEELRKGRHNVKEVEVW